METLQILLVAPEERATLVRADLARDDLPVRFAWTDTTTVKGALRALREARFDLVLLDAGSPDAGLAAVAKLAEEAPVVALAEGGDLAQGLQLLRAGAEDVLDPETDDPAGAARRLRFAVERAALRRAKQAAPLVR